MRLGLGARVYQAFLLSLLEHTQHLNLNDHSGIFIHY